MISLFAILLLGIAGANAECTANLYNCYLPYFNLFDMNAFCQTLGLLKNCIIQSNCKKTVFDKYVLSLVQSHGDKCDVCKVVNCSRQILMSSKNMTVCRAISAITKCHTDNKCNNVVKEYPTFFNICDSKDGKDGLKFENQLLKKLRDIWTAMKTKGPKTKPAKK